MQESLHDFISKIDDSFAIQDYSIIVPGIEYCFTRTRDKNIYKGKLKKLANNFELRFIFEKVQIYNGTNFQKFIEMLSTNEIDKIYYL